MVKTFNCGEAAIDSAERETLDNVEQKLKLHSLETSDLIHQYNLERLKEQQTMTTAPFGQLTVRCALSDDNYLEVRIFFEF